MEVYKERGQIRGHELEIEFIQNKLSLGARSVEGEKSFLTTCDVSKHRGL